MRTLTKLYKTNFVILAHRYHSRYDFLADIELIASNCEQYNGSDSCFTKNAKTILEYARSQLKEVSTKSTNNFTYFSIIIRIFLHITLTKFCCIQLMFYFRLLSNLI